MDAQLYQSLESGATVLAASHRLAHRLRLDYAQHAQQAGNVVWPTPNILTLNTYLAEVFKQQRQTQASIPRLLNELQTQTIWESIVSRSDQHELLGPAQASRAAVRSWQMLHQYQIPLQKLEQYEGKEARVFYSWATEFVNHTQQRNFLDGARLAAWLEQSSFVPNVQLHLIGFEFLVPAISSLLTHWEQQGCNVQRCSMPMSTRSVSSVSANDSDEELQMAARWGRQQIEAGKRRIGIVVPNLNTNAAQVKRIFNGILNPASRSALHDYTTAFTISASAALSSYPLVDHALLCLQLLLDEGDVIRWSQLLRSPFVAGYESEAAPRALLDLRMRTLQRDQWTLRDVSRISAETCPRFSAALELVSGLLLGFSDKALPSQWTSCFNQLLQAIGWARGRTLYSEEQQARNAFFDALAQLSSLDETLGRIHHTTASQLLRSACQQSRFAPESPDYPITVIDADTASGMQFETLWVAGLQSDNWPPPPDPDPFIPFELQYQQGVQASRADLCLQSAQDKLQRLIGSADDVVLSWAQHDDDVELRPSALLRNLKFDVTTVVSSQLMRSPVATLTQGLFQHKPVLESMLDARLPAHSDGAIKQGSRVFELQSRCAFRAQAELRLHATSPESPAPGISPLERGKLIHRVLQEVWSTLRDSNGLRTALLDERALLNQLQQIAGRVAQSLFLATTVHQQRMVGIEESVCCRLILSLLQHEARREHFSVLRSEERESFEVNGLKINIQLDRMDQLGDGSLLLIDYKSGDNYWEKDWLDLQEPGRPRSPQLPLYAVAHAEKLCGIAYAILAPGTTELRGFADRDGIASKIKDYAKRKPVYKPSLADDWPQLQHHWREVMEGLATQFKQGVANVDPLPNECQYCTLTSLCRIKEQQAADSLTDQENDVG